MIFLSLNTKKPKALMSLDFSLEVIRIKGDWWNRRELNPRPKINPIVFLRAYSVTLVSNSYPTD